MNKVINSIFIRNTYLFDLFLGFLLIFCIQPAGSQINFNFNSEFKYLKGESASTLPSTWNTLAYNDDSWNTGAAPFWYGDGSVGTLLDDMRYNYSSVYLRSSFEASEITLITEIILSVEYDDGFILWINGEEAFQMYAPFVPAYDAFSSDLHESGSIETYVLDAEELDLEEGENLIAIQFFNANLESSDIHFNCALKAELAEPGLSEFPGEIPVNFSHISGYYNSPFNLSFSYENDSAELYYSLDGSHPGTSGSAVKYTPGTTILIDPASNVGRDLTPTVVVRTSFRKDGYKPSYPQSGSYIFPESVRYQRYPGGTWPSSSINSQVLDYAIDVRISDGSRYRSRFENALKKLPAISIITSTANLFDADTGIYVNAWGHGDEWERECSVELIYPDSLAFAVNAGLRIRGGWSRHPEFPKHSFRLFFRSEYGNSKLEYPLFGSEGVNQYDKIDLRTSQNYAWAQRDSRNTMLREVFSRDTQRDMGQPYTRSRYYHLYLNGMYWGLYQTQERSEARFASDYFGGSPDDYDVIKVNTENWNYQIEATDGNLSLWQEVYNITLDGYSEMAPYYKIEGKDENGMPDKHSTKLVDIDNLMDYMLGIFYTGNFDAPTSSFGRNNGANNFFAIKQRNNKTSGFVFFNHDAEHSLFSEPASPGVGLYEDRVNIGTRTDDYKMNVSWFGAFHPQWLHFKLSENAEYRSRFADRVYSHFRDGGVFDEDSAIARYTKRMDEIDQPIIAESARWGDARGNSVSYERDVHWINEARKTRDDFLAVRRNIVISQLRVSGLYPYLLAPKLEVENKEVSTEDYYFKDSFELLIKNENGLGDIYYTLDGKDPRAFGDGIEPTAELSAGDISMVIESSTVIRSRIYDNGEWSPLNVIKCMNLDEDYTGLRVSELHYNPIDSIFGADTISGDDFEFIEFKNIGTHSINLSGLSLDSAVAYVFPEGTVIMPGEFLVIASDYINFFERYGMYASGVYNRNFSNGGELIVLSDKEGEVLLYFSYNDKSPWPLTPDGQGYSLVSKKVNPEGMPSSYDYWNASYFIGGSPFNDDSNSEMPIGIESELFSNLKVYPNPARDFLVIQFEPYDYGIEFDLRIYSITGVQVYAGKFQNGLRMDISSLGFEPGVYILNMNVEGVSKRVRLLYLGD